MSRLKNSLIFAVVFSLFLSSFVFADGGNNVDLFDSVDSSAEEVSIKPESVTEVKSEPKYVGMIRMSDDKGHIYDFAAAAAFYYDKDGNVKYNPADLNHFLGEIEKFYNKFYPSYTGVSIGKNGRASLVKVGGKRINRDAFIKEVTSRIANRNYDLFFVPFLADNSGGYNINNRVTLLGSYSTRYNAGNVGRTENICISGDYINGLVLKPGQVYSQNNTLRPLENKYKTAKVIVGNEFVDGKGGGLCQVSTTLFNTVLLSGLEVVERNNHSLKIGYVPAGRDAMVASGYSDFKFRNNFGHNIYIFYRRPANNVIQFDIYGHPSDKKSVSLSVSNSDAYNYSLTRKINGKSDGRVYRSTYQKQN